MKILFVCSLGMSSEIAIKALQKEAEKNDIKLDVKAVSTQEFASEVQKGYDVAMVAPQIRHRFKVLEESAVKADVPIALIIPRGYSPLGGAILLEQVLELTGNK